MAAYVITESGTHIPVRPDGGAETFKFEQIRRLLGCKYIQLLYSPDGKKIVAMDEDGKLTGSTPNPIATKKLKEIGIELFAGDYLVGKIMICDHEDIK